MTVCVPGFSLFCTLPPWEFRSESSQILLSTKFFHLSRQWFPLPCQGRSGWPPPLSASCPPCDCGQVVKFLSHCLLGEVGTLGHGVVTKIKLGDICRVPGQLREQCCSDRGDGGRLWAGPSARGLGSVTLVLFMSPTQARPGNHRGGVQVGSTDRAGNTPQM